MMFPVRSMAAMIGGLMITAPVLAGGVYVDTVLAFERGTGATSPLIENPAGALGAPDHVGGGGTAVSLGIGGSITLGFTGDRVLTVSGDARPDLRIWDAGAIHERAAVFLRPMPESLALLAAFSLEDGFLAVGETSTTEGLTEIDLDAVLPGFALGALRFDAVRLVDLETSFGLGNLAAGLDLDAVEAASWALRSGPATVPSPLAGGMGAALLLPLLLRRRTKATL